MGSSRMMLYERVDKVWSWKKLSTPVGLVVGTISTFHSLLNVLGINVASMGISWQTSRLESRYHKGYFTVKMDGDHFVKEAFFSNA
jgi:hypothetical protein